MTESDDDLIRRLQKEADVDKSTSHDPFLDLPVAKQVPVEESDLNQRGEPSCRIEGRRELPVGGFRSATESIRCELREGHPGAHRAGFERSRFRHRWHALEWPARSPGSEDGGG